MRRQHLPRHQPQLPGEQGVRQVEGREGGEEGGKQPFQLRQNLTDAQSSTPPDKNPSLLTLLWWRHRYWKFGALSVRACLLAARIRLKLGGEVAPGLWWAATRWRRPVSCVSQNPVSLSASGATIHHHHHRCIVKLSTTEASSRVPIKGTPIPSPNLPKNNTFS